MRVPPNLSLLHTAFGDPLGISLLGGLSVAVYRLSIRVPQGVPANSAVAARSTLAEVVSAASQIPGTLGNTLLIAARNSFILALFIGEPKPLGNKTKRVTQNEKLRH